MKLERKKVLITGASSGLGRGLAVELARAGNDLVITARREELLAEVTREAEGFGAKCIAVAADATDEAAAEAVVNAGIEAFGHLDLAILNAGGGTVQDRRRAISQQLLQRGFGVLSALRRGDVRIERIKIIAGDGLHWVEVMGNDRL